MIKASAHPLLHQFLTAVTGGPGVYADGSFNMDGVSGEDVADSEALLSRLSEDERQRFAVGDDRVQLADDKARAGLNLLPLNTIRDRLPAKSEPLPSKKGPTEEELKTEEEPKPAHQGAQRSGQRTRRTTAANRTTSL